MDLSGKSVPSVAAVTPRAPSPAPTSSLDDWGTRDNQRGIFVAPVATVRSILPEDDALLESSNDEMPMRRTAVSDDECGSPTTRRRKRTLLKPSHPRYPGPVLLESMSSYANTNIPPASVSNDRTSLRELARLIRSQKVQEKRVADSHNRLHRLLLAHHLSLRLVQCGTVAQHDLFEACRLGDKHTFAVLYNTLQDLRTTVDAMRRRALLDPGLDSPEPTYSNTSDIPDSHFNFLHEIPTATRDELLAFISVLRSDPTFLTNRVACLSTSEIDNLLPVGATVETGSVFGRPRAQVRKMGSTPSIRPGTVHSAVDRLLSFQRQDIFSVLFHGLFAGPSMPGSPEDVRRAGIWGTLCAKLISEPRPGGDKLLNSILDEYAHLRDWSCRQSFELFLMGVLRSGHFLVDRAEDRLWRGRSQDVGVLAGLADNGDAFIQSNCKDLFVLLGETHKTAGLPTGILEIGSEILTNLGDKRHRLALERFIVHRWFLGRFLPDAIINPERYGLLGSHHITESARMSILQPLAAEIQRYVNDAVFKWQHTIPERPEIRSTIELMKSRIKFSPQLTELSRGIAQPKAPKSYNISAQPCLMLCAGDLVTLVNGLFPERRPPSRLCDSEAPFSHAEWASAASSVSGSSAPFSASSISGDASSVLSTSASSITSDTTSRAQLHSDISKSNSQVSLRTFNPAELEDLPGTDDEYGRRLRVTCAEMAESLSPSKISGACHPSEEHWALVYVSPDGLQLGLDAFNDYACVIDDDTDNDTDGQHESDRVSSVEMFDSYEELKGTVIQLLEEYDVPVGLDEDEDSVPTLAMIRHAATNKRFASKQQATASLLAPEISEEQHFGSRLGPDAASATDFQDITGNVDNIVPPASLPLLAMLKAAQRQNQEDANFSAALRYHRAEQLLTAMQNSNNSLLSSNHGRLNHYLSRSSRDSLRRCKVTLDKLEYWHTWANSSIEKSQSILHSVFLRIGALRDKMWYSSDVQNSSVYEEARNVVGALKAMGLPWKVSGAKPRQPKLRHVKPSSNNFVLRQEGQTLEILAAAGNMGGPNKLSDEQSELIASWLSTNDVQNLCKGEERIHRFCYEVSRCTDQLIGESVLDAPVLWASELFIRDRSVFDQGFDQGDILLASTNNARGNDVYPMSFRPGSSRLYNAFDTSSPGSYNMSQTSFGSLGHQRTFSPAFPPSSPVSLLNLSIRDTHQPQRSSSPFVTDYTQGRPARYSPSPTPRIRSNKGRFLQHLKRKLLSLLLSDLAPGLFNGGCETDAWVFGRLGSALTMRQEHIEREATRAMPNSDPSIQETSTGSAVTAEAHLLDTVSIEPALQPSLGSFPFAQILHQLMLRLSAIVDPFAKLDTLHELQNMVIASLADSNHTKDKRDPFKARSPAARQQTCTDQIIQAFKDLFKGVGAHQSTLFRDLQYVATFVPREVLDRDRRAAAFWNAVAAAQSIKHDMCSAMIEVADAVVARATERRSAPQPMPAVVTQPSDTNATAAGVDAPQIPLPAETDSPWLKHFAAFTMAEAAQMLIIAAKEGDAVAQRELGIFYLTHPELLPRALCPFTQPKSVFKATLLGQSDRERQKKADQNLERADPMTMCVAQHWMECSRNGGDQLAIEYLKARDEMERLR